MSADFTTTLEVRGTKEECTEIMKVLCYFTNDRYEQYRGKRDCWYLDETLCAPEEEVKRRWKEGEMSLMLGGPYGVWDGLLGDGIDLFERIADAAPACQFKGSISGWDPGAEQSLKAELKNGLLYLGSSYYEFGGGFDEDDEYFDDEDDEYFDDEENDETAEADVSWDRVYDPATKKYARVSKAVEGDSVTVSITVTDLQDQLHTLELQSAFIEDPITFDCWPEDILVTNNADELIKLLAETISGTGSAVQVKKLEAFGETLRGIDFRRVELVKIHDHKAPFFFSWLRSAEMKKLAKKVRTCAEKNRQKNVDEFNAYLKEFRTWFPATDQTPQFPDLCMYHRVEQENGWISKSRNPESRFDGNLRLDWHCAAASVQEFAELICSKENPREYAVERVTVDYTAGTIDQSAIYMPFMPEH